MKVKINVINRGDVPEEVLKKIISLYNHFNLKIHFIDGKGMRYNEWIQKECENAQADIVGFINCRYIPLSKNSILNACNFLKNNFSIYGILRQEYWGKESQKMYHDFIHTDMMFMYIPMFRISPVKILTEKRPPLEQLHLWGETKQLTFRHLYPTKFNKLKSKNDIIFKYGVMGSRVIYGEDEFFTLNDEWTEENVDFTIRLIDNIMYNKPLETFEYRCNSIDLYFNEMRKLHHA